MPALPLSAQADTQIALVIGKGFQYAGVSLFEALDPPHIADKVFTLVALDGTPFFVGEIFNLIYGFHLLIQTMRSTLACGANGTSARKGR